MKASWSRPLVQAGADWQVVGFHGLASLTTIRFVSNDWLPLRRQVGVGREVAAKRLLEFMRPRVLAREIRT
jgi:hypothetical protein